LAASPNGLQVGGGINADNAQQWLDAGAEKVIITSYLFPGARFDRKRLEEVERVVGKDKLVIDVSCRRRGSSWVVAMNGWKDLTDIEVNAGEFLLSMGRAATHDRINTHV
jgi:phosphoribosylformimino-5-aminoimidazole carboxamide ribotide isomerase